MLDVRVGVRRHRRRRNTIRTLIRTRLSAAATALAIALSLVVAGAAGPALAAPGSTISGPEFPTLAYGQALDLSYPMGGDPAPTASVSAGALPDGAHLDPATGKITGTPSAPGTYTFTLTASNGQQPDGFIDVTLLVTASAKLSGTPPDATRGTPYSFDYTLGGWPLPTTVVSSGTFPPGLTLSTDGKVTGTPTLGGTFDFDVHVANTVDEWDYSQSITVLGSPTISGPSEIVLQPGDTANAVYSFTGGPAPTVTTTGDIPVGLAFTTQTNPDGTVSGLISGMADNSGEFRLVIHASNGHDPAAEHPVVIKSFGAPWIGPVADPATAGEPYSFTFDYRGLPVPTISVIDGELPDGLTLDSDGLLHGTPTQSGIYQFTVAATSGYGSSSGPVTMLVYGPPRISGPSVIVHDAGDQVTEQYHGEGYPRPTLSVSAGSVPPGLTFDADTGTLAGTATLGGQFHFTITASNSISPDAQLDVVFTTFGRPIVFGITDDAAIVGEQFSATINSAGWPAPTYAVVDGTELPPGLTLSPDGRITGKPTESGFYTFHIGASNSYGSNTGLITMSVSGPARLEGPAELLGIVGDAFSADYTAAGYPPPVLSTTGQLPPGISFDPDTWELSGTVGGPGATYHFNIVASTGVGRGTVLPVTFTAGVLPGMDDLLPHAGVDVPYEHQLALTGYPTPEVLVDPHDLPTGITLSESGLLSGTPREEGVFVFNVTVQNVTGSRLIQLGLVVDEVPPTITTHSLPQAINGEAYTAELSAVGSGSITWDLAPGSRPLPDGLRLKTDGSFAGTPTQTGDFSILVRATNSVGANTQPLTLSVAALPGAPVIGALAGGDGKVTVSFTPGATGSSPTTGYEISAHNITQPTLPDIVQAASGSPKIVNGLVNGDGYSFTVRAVSADGPGAWSAPSSALTVGVVPVITGDDPPPMVIGKPYRYTFAVSGAPTPTVSLTGIILPLGLAFTTEDDPQGGLTGVISGIPAKGASATYVFVTAGNALGEGDFSFTLPLAAGPLPGGDDDGAGSDDGAGGGVVDDGAGDVGGGSGAGGGAVDSGAPGAAAVRGASHAGDRLATTGASSDTGTFTLVAMLLVMAGAGMLLRRRRTQP